MICPGECPSFVARVVRCPVCNSSSSEFIYKSSYGEILGCNDCITRCLSDEIVSWEGYDDGDDCDMSVL